MRRSRLPGQRSPSSVWLWLLVGGAVLNQITVHLVRPTTTYKLLEFGAGSLTVGLVTAGYAVLPLLLALVLGSYAQRTISLKPLLVGGSILVTVGAVALAGAGGVAWIGVASAVMGLGQLVFTIGGQSAIARFSKNSQLDMAFGWFTAGFAAGQMVGPLLGGLLLTEGAVTMGTDRPSANPSLTSIDATLWIGVVISVPAVLILQFSGKRYRRKIEEKDQATATEADPLGSEHNTEIEPNFRSPIPRRPTAGQILARQGVPSHLVASIALVATMDVLTAFLPLIGSEAGVSPFWIGILLAARAGASIVSRALLPVLRRFFARGSLVLASLIVTAVALAVPPFAMDSLWIATVALVVAGFFSGVGQPLTMTLVSQAVPEEWRSSTLALRLMGNRFGVVVVPLLAGAIAGPLGPGAAIWLTCGLLGVSGAEKSVRAVRRK